MSFNESPSKDFNESSSKDFAATDQHKKETAKKKNEATKVKSTMDIIAWDISTEIDNDAETEEINFALSLLDEARIRQAYARLEALIDALAL